MSQAMLSAAKLHENGYISASTALKQDFTFDGNTNRTSPEKESSQAIVLKPRETTHQSLKM
jgi:hypothetical protein